MTRRRMTSLRRARIFDSAGGVCHICERRILAGEPWEVEHVIALEISRDDSDENLRPAHVACHREKTSEDAALIAKTRRVRAKHVGAWQPKQKIPGSKGSGWRKPLNGPAYRVKE